MGSESMGSGSGSGVGDSGEKVVGSFSDKPAKNMRVAVVRCFVRGISVSGSGMVEVESICSDMIYTK